ncbi:MAG: flagellin [Burkholderiaceae bacterium]|nr:flagellin [Burkholderiaceae bacterium]
MALTISTNVASLNAQRHLARSTIALNTTVQRLSSGLRVNSAKDDAAGLAISERMSTQVRGMAVARRNANDGISLSQTAEGAMQKLTDILQRSRELAVQAVNWTNSASDRQALDNEREQLLQEFSRIVSTSNFNGQKLIDGSFIAQTFQVGANAGEVIGLDLPSLQAPDLGAAIWTLGSFPFSQGNIGLSAGDLVLRGMAIPVAQNESLTSIAKKVNSASFEPKIYAEVSGTSATVNFGTPAIWPVDVTLKLANGDTTKVQTVAFTWNPNDPSATQEVFRTINAVSDQTGIRATGVYQTGLGLQLVNDTEEIRLLNDSAPGVNMLVSDWDGSAYSVSRNAAGADGNGAFGGPNDVLVNGKVTLISEDEFSVNGGSYDQDDNPVGPFPDAVAYSGRTAKLSDAKITTPAAATRALLIYDAAIKQVSRARADVGAMQSRFESVVTNLGIAEENTAAARGRIVDADYAMEAANLSRTQILQQASMAMVAQANQMPQSVLQLLKS